MKVLHLNKKGELMNTWERYHIHRLSRNDLQLNDTYADVNNPIFKVIDSHYKRINPLSLFLTQIQCHFLPSSPILLSPLPLSELTNKAAIQTLTTKPTTKETRKQCK
jgi:hypothetical protein